MEAAAASCCWRKMSAALGLGWPEAAVTAGLGRGCSPWLEGGRLLRSVLGSGGGMGGGLPLSLLPSFSPMMEISESLLIADGTPPRCGSRLMSGETLADSTDRMDPDGEPEPAVDDRTGDREASRLKKISFR